LKKSPLGLKEELRFCDVRVSREREEWGKSLALHYERKPSHFGKLRTGSCILHCKRW
jgi:hypothetical protein